MKLALVTVTYNSRSVIQDFLQCCSEQTFKEYLVIVVDNNSSDQTLELIQQFKPALPLKVFAEYENHGVAKGNNIGIEFALQQRADYVLLINNDVTFEAGFFQKLLDKMDEYKEASAVVPKINFFDPPDRIWYGGGKFSYWKGPLATHIAYGKRDKSSAATNQRYVEYAPTCAMILRASVFATTGLMDEKYFVYYDDTDFCFRMKARKEKILYVPAVRLFHKVSFLTGGEKSKFTIRMFSRNQIYFIRKHFPRPQQWYFIAIILVKNMLRFLLGKDNIEDYRLRCSSMKEASKMISQYKL